MNHGHATGLAVVVKLGEPALVLRYLLCSQPPNDGTQVIADSHVLAQIALDCPAIGGEVGMVLKCGTY